jgi:glycosyltransferase involved in cell wall biosynthesis
MKWIIAAATAFPEVPFTIFGTETPDFESPANIRYVGWRPAEEMAEAVRHTPVFLRLPEHDGFAFSVIEALGAGCEVIWTMPGERALHATTPEEMIRILREALAKVEARGNTPNGENRAWALAHYDKKAVLDHYIQTLRSEK